MSILSAARRKVGAFIGGTGFEAGMFGRRMSKFQATTAHVNTLLAQSGPTMLARARHITRNNGYANNAVEAWAGNVVGAGITPSFQTTNKALKKKLTKLYRDWIDEADAEGVTDFYGIQRRAAREAFIAGECFIRRIPRRLSDDLSVPMQLQLIPSEMLPIGKSEPVAGGGEIRQGVEFNAAGRRVAYHFYKKHPGDYTGFGGGSTDTVRVPAIDVIHLIDPVDAGQLRGVSRFAPAIVKLFLLDIYDDAELDRKKVAAMHALFITTETPEDWEPSDNAEEPGAPPEPAIDLQPGMVGILKPGEDIKTSSPADSGVTYEPFQYRTLLQVSAALGIPYAVLTNDMVKANYSNTRAALVEFRRRVEAFQHSVMAFQLCQPVMRWFMDTVYLADLAAMPGYERRRREYQVTKWLPPKFDWVDPWKDAKAEIEQINAKLKSRTMAIAERGYDAEEIDEEIAADMAREKKLGIWIDPNPNPQIGHNGGPPIDGGPENGAATTTTTTKGNAND